MILLISEYAFNFEIRVGEDGNDIGKNEICHKQIVKVSTRVTSFTCPPTIFGDWVSVNKSSNDPDNELLLLYEVKVFGK